MSQSGRRVTAVFGMLPEPMGYSLAKFSRSARPYPEWARDLTSSDAEGFYNTYYFDYGHASIADLVHLPIVVEGISEVVAFEMWESQLIDGQQSSTRYQDFSKRSVITPPEINSTALQQPFEERCSQMIDVYKEMKQPVVERFKATKDSPADMDKEKAERIYNARSFDITRYFLPNSISTGQGQIMSARTAEKMLKKMLASPLQEVRDTAEEMKDAFMRAEPFNPADKKLEELLKDYPGLYEKTREVCGFGKPVAPTIIKYAKADEYVLKTRLEFSSAASDLFPDDPRKLVNPGAELFIHVDPTVDFISSMFYKVAPYPYNYIKNKVESLKDSERNELLRRANVHRSKHDPLPEEAGTNVLIYDVCLDLGASRDLNRHRNLVKINQPVTPLLGWSIPQPTNDENMLREIGWEKRFNEEMGKTFALAIEIYNWKPALSVYVLPMATDRRMLLKMDPRQLEYMTNDRTSVQGHFSYRKIVYQMHGLFQEKYPAHASHFRVTHPSVENFFQR